MSSDAAVTLDMHGLCFWFAVFLAASAVLLFLGGGAWSDALAGIDVLGALLAFGVWLS